MPRSKQIELKHFIGDKVNIIDDSITGHVISVWIHSADDIRYECQWIKNGDTTSGYLREFQIKKKGKATKKKVGY